MSDNSIRHCEVSAAAKGQESTLCIKEYRIVSVNHDMIGIERASYGREAKTRKYKLTVHRASLLEEALRRVQTEPIVSIRYGGVILLHCPKEV